MSEVFKCPVCNGAGLMSGGYFDRAGDCDTWTSNHAMETCKVCEGKGYIVLTESEQK